jgi:sugar phosphate isomerase/epimerase
MHIKISENVIFPIFTRCVTSDELSYKEALHHLIIISYTFLLYTAIDSIRYTDPKTVMIMLWISTSCLTNSPLDVALENIGSLTKGVEIVDGGKHYIQNHELLGSYPYKYAFNLKHLDINPASIIEPIRKAAVDVIRQRFSIAAEFGAQVVIHPGYVSFLEDLPKARQQLSRSLTELMISGQELGITFMVRNAGNTELALLRKPDELSSMSIIPLSLDIGNAHQNNCLEDFLYEGASRYVCLYDNNGSTPEHLDIGRGTIDFSLVAEAMRANGAVGVLEMPTYRRAYDAIKALRRFDIG